MSNFSHVAAYGSPRVGRAVPMPAALPSSGGGGNNKFVRKTVEQLVLELGNNDLRENALEELSNKKECFDELAPLLWNSFGTIASLLQEVISIYPLLSPPNLTIAESTRVCHALALLQCVASHQDTRMLFLNAHIPLYVLPFLNTTCKFRPFEFLRLTSLGIIAALVKVDDTNVIAFLLEAEIFPLCLRTMDLGCVLSKAVATLIVQKILIDNMGFEYICTNAERFFALARVLRKMVAALTEHRCADQSCAKLLKHIIRCYLRLSDNERACGALQSCLPEALRDGSFGSLLQDEEIARNWLQQLLHRVQPSRGVGF